MAFMGHLGNALGAHIPTCEALSPTWECMFTCFHMLPTSHMGTSFRVGEPLAHKENMCSHVEEHLKTLN